MSKEPTRAQLSSRLTYQSKIPAFLLRMQRGMGGAGGGGDDEDDEFEYDGSGRPPIPRRPAIPERPEDEPGSADEEDADEKPQVVVLREGKHLTEREAENERRKAKGLPPLPESSLDDGAVEGAPGKRALGAEAKPAKPQGLSFSSASTVKGKGSKRKAVGDGRDDADTPNASAAKTRKKKTKKPEKKLLSFDEDA